MTEQAGLFIKAAAAMQLGTEARVVPVERTAWQVSIPVSLKIVACLEEEA